ENIESGNYLTMPTANDYDIIKSTATATQKSEWTKVDKGNGNFLLENVASGKRIRTTKHADMFNNPGDNFWVEVSPLSWEGSWVQWYFTQVPKSALDLEVDEREISFYPNPANNYIQVEGVLKQAEIQIFNMSGQLVSTSILNTNGIINLDNIESGIYIMKAVENNKISIHRIIIDKE
ncbi:MAG: T9SS type A sorting domain-containing protein, partial [Bacteroidales bacterium]|nr:T9SS type A sorting domain-containing protein [Bacteroidales bacterium]